MLVKRLSRLLTDMRRDGFIRRNFNVYLFEHETKKESMAILQAETDDHNVFISFIKEPNDDILINVESTPIIKGVPEYLQASEYDFYIEDDELTDITIDILNQYGVCNGK